MIISKNPFIKHYNLNDSISKSDNIIMLYNFIMRTTTNKILAETIAFYYVEAINRNSENLDIVDAYCKYWEIWEYIHD